MTCCYIGNLIHLVLEDEKGSALGIIAMAALSNDQIRSAFRKALCRRSLEK